MYKGLCRLASGVKQKSAAEIIKGGIQTAMGIAGTAFVYSLDSRIIVSVHQASAIALSSSFVAKLGYHDLVKGRYRPGVCKILLGIGGIASAGYYVYSTCIHQDTLSDIYQDTLSADQIAFLEAHKAEIEQMVQEKEPSGNWTELGTGASKKAFVHPDFPGMLIKMPVSEVGFRGTTGEDDLRIDYANLKQIRSIAAAFDRIVLPESHLYSTSKGLMIVEQRFHFADFFTVSDSPDKKEAMNQFYAFEKAADLCDLHPKYEHNAGIIFPTTPAKIGVIDFDCKHDKVFDVNLKRVWNRLKWDWNFINPSTHFFVSRNINQGSILILAGGTAVSCGVAAVAKKISGINPKTVLRLGFGFGVVAAGFMAFIGVNPQPAASLVGVGYGMAVTSVVTSAAVIACSLGKRLFSACRAHFHRRS